MRRFFVTWLLAGFLLTFFIVFHSAGQQPAGGKGNQELLALVPKIVASWESFDLSKIEPYYASDADLLYFDLAPLKCNNWAEYRTGAPKALFEPNRSIKLKVNDDLRVHSRGSLAWTVFTFGADIVNKQGASSHIDGRWTMVLEKRQHGWIVVHEHVSAPLGGS